MNRARRGFTLVELLVVITIIAMLAGLLLPAVQRAREAGRKTQCLNNMHNVALAVAQYDSSKQKFPPAYTIYRAGTSPTFLGWPAKLLPLMERNDLYERFVHGASVAAFDANSLDSAPVKVDLLTCPSAADSGAAPIHFAVNCGRADHATKNMVDFNENGTFFADFAAATGQTPVAPISASYIGRYDGNSQTLMLTENLNCQKVWNEPQSNYYEGLTGVVWSATTPSVGLNKLADAFPGFADSTAINYARPSSAHIQGFNAAFCDGSVKFLSDEIAYRVYALISTPRGVQSKKPGTGTTADPLVLTTAESTEYSGWVTTPLSDSDLTQ